ncbi:hypothetical protein V8G54_025993 [Vigna mungo]|uniref:Uncharacterized protein n=1 Tax=Vigna mungo TaxID=3915 RepID=A0AAQ3MZC4_VIGMU
MVVARFNPSPEVLCSAYTASPSSEKTLTMHTTFPKYVVALATIVGSIFGGVGITCLPLGLIFSFIQRPKAVITRSQYIKAEATWALTVIGYLAKLVLRILGFYDFHVSSNLRFENCAWLIVSVSWVGHIIIYLLVDPPISPFLNEVFIKLDNIWGLLGTPAFAFFCFYLILVVIVGVMMEFIEAITAFVNNIPDSGSGGLVRFKSFIKDEDDGGFSTRRNHRSF